MRNFLAVDTSSRYLSVVAVNGDKVVKRNLPDCALKHSVLLMDEVDAAMREANLTPQACDFFAAVTGPGSFTGIRIGVSCVKGFALGAQKPVKAITAFDVIAYNTNDTAFAAVIDAAHGSYYVCAYQNGKVTLPPCYLSAEAVLALGLPLYGFENLQLDNYTKIETDLFAAVMASPAPLTAEISALYVRKSQAEEGRK